MRLVDLYGQNAIMALGVPALNLTWPPHNRAPVLFRPWSHHWAG